MKYRETERGSGEVEEGEGNQNTSKSIKETKEYMNVNDKPPRKNWRGEKVTENEDTHRKKEKKREKKNENII